MVCLVREREVRIGLLEVLPGFEQTQRRANDAGAIDGEANKIKAIKDDVKKYAKGDAKNPAWINGYKLKAEKLVKQKEKVWAAFDKLSYTHKKEYTRWITGAKREETRAARLAKSVEMLRSGVKTPDSPGR